MEGNHNLLDFLSRHASNRDESLHEKMAEDYVNFLCMEAVPKAVTLTEIQTATSEDVTLQCLIDIIRNQSWNRIVPGTLYIWISVDRFPLETTCL